MAENHGGHGLLEGRVMLLAGVGRGLGTHIARNAVAAGAKVVMAARSPAVGEQLAADLGESASFRACDITVDSDCADLVQTAVDQYGGVDAVVLNAMASTGATTLESDPVDAWREAFEVNLFGSLRVVKAALPALEESRSASVVFIGSQITRRVFPGRGPYASSKAAVTTAAQVLAQELGPSGIRVNTLVPGRMWGEPLQAAVSRLAAERGRSETAEVEHWIESTALKRLATDEECARVAIFLASDLAAAVTGQTIDANAGETMS